MNWENYGLEEEEPEKSKLEYPSILNVRTSVKDQVKASQIERFHDPAKDVNRQMYLSIIVEFTDLLLQNKMQEIADKILTEDCKTFLFSSRTERIPIQYATEKQGFIKLFSDIKIEGIQVREVYVDVKKYTVIQMCNYEVSYDNTDSIWHEIVFTLFTIKDDKICKLRSLFCHQSEVHGEDIFKPSKQELMFAKVKEINYALAGYQPDFDTVASLFNENTVYRIWRWGDSKCFVFGKSDFAVKMRELEEEYILKCIVPYEITFDSEFVVGTYGYYLEKKSTGQKFVWITRCVYAFDENINLLKIAQQGDLFPEEEAAIPSEFNSRDKLSNNLQQFFDNIRPNFDWFYKGLVHSTVDICRLGPENFPYASQGQGIDQLSKFHNTIRSTGASIEWIRPIDSFIDQQGPSYDIAIVLLCWQGSFGSETDKVDRKRLNSLIFFRVAFENGKIIKILQSLFEIPYAIFSPYDDIEFSAINIKNVDKTGNE